MGKRRLLPLGTILLLVVVVAVVFGFTSVFTSKAHATSSVFLIQNLATGLCLDVGPQSNHNPGAHPYTYTCNSANPNQQWFLQPNSTRFGSSIDPLSVESVGYPGACLDHGDTSKLTGGASSYLFQCFYGSGQDWVLQPDLQGHGTYYAGNSGLFLSENVTLTNQGWLQPESLWVDVYM